MYTVRYTAVPIAPSPMSVTAARRIDPGIQSSAVVTGASSSDATASTTSRSARCMIPPRQSTPTASPFARAYDTTIEAARAAHREGDGKRWEREAIPGAIADRYAGRGDVLSEWRDPAVRVAEFGET